MIPCCRESCPARRCPQFLLADETGRQHLQHQETGEGTEQAIEDEPGAAWWKIGTHHAQEQESWQGVTWNTRRRRTRRSCRRETQPLEPDAEYQHQTDGARDGEECRLANRYMMRVLCNAKKSRLGKGILTPWACIHRS